MEICKRRTTVKRVKDNIVVNSTTEIRKGKTSYTIEAIKVDEDGWEVVLAGYYNLKNSTKANSIYLETIHKISNGDLG